MFVYNDRSRIFRNDNVNCLRRSSSSFILICSDDAECSSAKNQWFAGQATSKHIPVGLIISTLIFVEIIIVIGGWKYKPEIFDINNSITQISVSNTHSLGQILYTDYIHIFQISGMILLVAMIGAIVLTFRQRAGVKKQSYIKQISRERAEGVEVLEVKTNEGVRIDD